MTVSRVVNGRQAVSERTRGRVLAAVEKLGYVPYAAARGLARGQTNVIGILVPDIISEWTLPLVLGAAREGEKFGYRLLLHTTGYGAARGAGDGVPLAESDWIDGLIVASWRVPTSLARQLDARAKPVVIVDGYARPRGVMWVSAADRTGMAAAVEHLLALGHRRIGYIGGGRRPYLAQQRRAGFLDGLKRAGEEADPALMVEGDFTRESGIAAARQLLTTSRVPTAILCANDPMALGVLQVAHEMGIAVPQELSVAGCDDTLAAQASPPLTSVRRPYEEMGATALRLLASAAAPRNSHADSQQSANGKRPPQIDLDTMLVIRASTAPPRQ